MKSINIKQPKYVLPLFILPFILLIGYILSGMMSEENETSKLVELPCFNTEVPEANLEKKHTQSKFEALKGAFDKSSDFSSIQAIEKEELDAIEKGGSLYTSEEMKLIDSLNQASNLKRREISEQEENFGDYSSPKNVTLETNATSEANAILEANLISDKTPVKSRMQEEMELFKIQMAYMDSLQNPKPKKVKRKPKTPEVPPVELLKNEDVKSSHFNSIKTSNNKSPITAILDESIKVVKGSRVKIRLLENVVLDENTLLKGSYIYGIVTKFSKQRVMINITSIMVNNIHIKVDISIFDVDGMEGFYVPNSKFRDLTKDIGKQSSSQSLSSDGDDENSLTQMAFGAIKDVYTNSTQALSQVIGENKAKLKYNSQVYLINKKSKNQ